MTVQTLPHRSPATAAESARLEIRNASSRDLDAIAAIDAFHSGASKRNDWADKLARVDAASSSRGSSGDPGRSEREGNVAFVACLERRVIGYVFVEARAWEFGSPLCGWITAIGVDPAHTRGGVALALCREACAWLRRRGIESVRTMVRRDAVEVLSFFRASGFYAGPYLELELDL
jgi:ribosomal protein S18 acetylase RimI-like enzyme